MDARGADTELLDAVATWYSVPRLRSADVHEAAVRAVTADALSEEGAWRLGLEAVPLNEIALRVVLILLALKAGLLGGAWAGIRLPALPVISALSAR